MGAITAQSEVRLNELKEGLEKSEQLTNGMVGILDSFSVRLKKMDEAIMPVYQQTRRLTQLQESIQLRKWGRGREEGRVKGRERKGKGREGGKEGRKEGTKGGTNGMILKKGESV